MIAKLSKNDKDFFKTSDLNTDEIIKNSIS